MARSRNLKPGFFTNDVLAEVNPLGRLLFQGLWCHADREGRLFDRPKKIKVEILPYDECDVDHLLEALAARAFITRYEVAGIKYIQINNFSKHQNPHVKEVASTIPAPDKHQSSRADSLLPLPLTLNPSTALSGEPDEVPLAAKKLNGTTGQAVEVLQFLNDKTKRKFRGLDGRGRPTPNLKFIVARLESGATVQDCKTVVARKFREWSSDDKMRMYLRPETLFNATKFEQYLGECTTEEMPRG